jgi:hypothetical protein
MKVCFKVGNKIFETSDIEMKNYISNKTLVEVIKKVLKDGDHEDKDKNVTILGIK